MYLPIADIGDCSVGVTITVIGVVDVPPDNITPTGTYPSDSITTYCSNVKFTKSTE